MKSSCDWNRQPNVDMAADAILAEGKATLDTITAYQVAERLGGSANPSLYAKFRDWRARRRTEVEPATVDVPPEVEANIRAIFARLTDDGISACLNAVRIVGGSFDRVAALRVGDAERRADRAEAETTDALAIGERIERELSAATVRIAELEQALADAQRREDRLAGRLEQRAVDLAADLAVTLRNRPRHNTSAAASGVDTANEEGDDDTADGSIRTERADAGDAGDADSISSALSAAASPDAQLLLTFHGSSDESKTGEDVRHE